MSIPLRDLEREREKEAEKKREEEEKALKEYMKYRDHEKEEQKRLDRLT